MAQIINCHCSNVLRSHNAVRTPKHSAACQRSLPRVLRNPAICALVGGARNVERASYDKVDDLVSRITLLRRSVSSAAKDEQYKLAASMAAQIKALETTLPPGTLQMLQWTEKLLSHDKMDRLEAMTQIWDLSASEPLPTSLLSLVRHHFILGVWPGTLSLQQQEQLETLSDLLLRQTDQCNEDWFEDVCRQMHSMDNELREAVSEVVVMRTKKILDNISVRVLLDRAQRQTSVAEATQKVAELQEELTSTVQQQELLRVLSMVMAPGLLTLLAMDVSHFEHPALPFCHGLLASYSLLLLASFMQMLARFQSIADRQQALQAKHKWLGL